ncbi:disulfide bond formation protein B [Salmonella enterica]
MCIAALLIIIVPVGIACIVLGYGMGDNPCILCWEERIAMILAALTMIFITRYGLQLRYIGTLVLICDTDYGLASVTVPDIC